LVILVKREGGLNVKKEDTKWPAGVWPLKKNREASKMDSVIAKIGPHQTGFEFLR